MDASLITFSTFSAGTVCVFVLTSLASDILFRDRSRINKRLTDEFRSSLRGRVKQSSLFKSFNEKNSVTEDESPGLVARIETAIEQSGMELAAEKLLAISCCAGLCAMFVVPVLQLPWICALPAMATGFCLPPFYVLAKRKKRMAKLCEQLPDAFELMSRAVRAGQTMASAMHLVAQHGKAPVADEFAYCCEQQSLGLPQAVPLRDLARRNPIMELQMFVVALLVQRQSGGNPVDVLNNLSALIRKRLRMKGRVKALTSEGRMQAIVLAVLPLVAFAAIYILNRDYAQILLDHPRLLAGTIAAQGVGIVWIRKVVNFEY